MCIAEWEEKKRKHVTGSTLQMIDCHKKLFALPALIVKKAECQTAGIPHSLDPGPWTLGSCPGKVTTHSCFYLTSCHLTTIFGVLLLAFLILTIFKGLPRWLNGKESTCQCRRCKFDPWMGEIPWGRDGILLQYSCLKSPIDRGDWQVQSIGSQRVGHD